MPISEKIQKEFDTPIHRNSIRRFAIKDKIDKLESIRTYFQNNFAKMNYPEYRKKGLPISSCHVESLIKQFNIRIKSSEKLMSRFLNRGKGYNECS